MGKKVPDSNLELTFDGSGNIQGQLYYGGDTTNTAHTPVTKANGDDVYLARSVFEPILMAAHADVALKADGAVMEEALKGDNVPPRGRDLVGQHAHRVPDRAPQGARRAVHLEVHAGVSQSSGAPLPRRPTMTPAR